MTVSFDLVSETLHLRFGKHEFTVWHPVSDDSNVLIGISEETGRITGVMIENFEPGQRVSIPLDADLRLTTQLAVQDEDFLEKLAAANPELVAKCEAMAAERKQREEQRVRAVAESRGEYRINED